MFAIFGGLYYWWPKIFGRMLDERLGKLHFWLVFVGFNLAFFPSTCSGCSGCRGASTRTERGIWEVYNMISSIGAVTMAVGMLVFVFNIIQTARERARATNDPWLADTLEWYATSPPPPGTSTASRTSSARGRCATSPAAGRRRDGCDRGPWARCSRSGIRATALAVVSGAAGWQRLTGCSPRSRCRRSSGC